MIADGKQQGYCCDNPTINFGWHLGAEDHEDSASARLMKLDKVECTNCGAEYVFDTRDNTACPVRMRSEDGSVIILAIKQKRVRLQ